MLELTARPFALSSLRSLEQPEQIIVYNAPIELYVVFRTKNAVLRRIVTSVLTFVNRVPNFLCSIPLSEKKRGA